MAFMKTLCNNTFFVLLIIISFFIAIKPEFIKLKKLPNDNYFIIKTDGLYKYNHDFSECNRIYSFTSANQIKTSDDIINTLISEIKQDDITYIICLSKKRIYIYNYNDNELYNSPYYLSELNTNKDYKAEGVNYNLIPYNLNENILYFIIILIIEGSISDIGNKIAFLYYNINILNSKVTYEYNKIFMDKTIVLFITTSYISPFNISCLLSSNSSDEIECFYSYDYQKYFKSMNFLIKNDPNDKYEIKKSSKEIIKIKSVISDDKNNIFSCYLTETKSSLCFHKNKQNLNKYDEINTSILSSCKDLETYYFEESGEFILLCKTGNYKFIIQRYAIDSNDLNYKTSYEIILENCIYLKEYSLIYNKTVNNYNLITDCNFTETSSYCLIKDDKNITNNENDYLDFETEEIISSVINDNYVDNTNKGIYIIDQDSFESYIIKMYNESNKELTTLLDSVMNIIKSNDEISTFGFGELKLQVIPPNYTENKNESHTETSECEELLKEYYNISKVEKVNIYIKDNDTNALCEEQISLAFRNTKNELLDNSICNNSNFTYYCRLKNNTSFDLDNFLKYKDKNIDILNPKDKFFNDICYPYSEDGDDIIIGDRRTDIYQNFSVCQEGCTLENFDAENKLFACNCKMNEIISSRVAATHYEDFEDVSFFDSNIDIIQCYNLVFSFNNKNDNIGFWIFSFLLIFYIVSIGFYFYKGIKPTMKYVFDEMVKYGYLNKDDKMFFEKDKKKELKSSKNIKKKSTKKHSNPIKKSRISVPNVNKINNTLNVNVMLNKTKRRQKKSKTFKNIKNTSKAKLTSTGDAKGNKYEDEVDFNFGLIKKSINNKDKYLTQESNQTLHNYSFKDACQYDRRSYLRIYYIYLLSKQILFHTFFQKTPLELFPLRICHLIFMLSTDLSLNGLLYLKDNISKKYKYSKSFFLFAFSDNITVIIYSTLLCFVLMTLLSKLSSSSNAIRKVFTKEEEKMRKNKKYKVDEKRKNYIFKEIEKILRRLKIKIVILIIIQIILMMFFWYYITVFCHVYKSTQQSWLWDSFLSIISRMVIEFLFAMLFAKLYLISIQSNIYTIYRIVMFIYDFS